MFLTFTIAGLTSRFFKGIPSIHEIECSGRGLGSDVDLFGMTLYTAHDSRKLAYVNLKKNECSTSRGYSACVIDRADSRNSRLVTLLLGLRELESRRVGCNITGFRSGEAHILSWSIVIRQTRAYIILYCTTMIKTTVIRRTILINTFIILISVLVCFRNFSL